MAELKSSRGGWRNGGRPKIEGHECRWIIPQDIYELYKEKGSAWLWDAVRFKVAFDEMQKKNASI